MVKEPLWLISEDLYNESILTINSEFRQLHRAIMTNKTNFMNEFAESFVSHGFGKSAIMFTREPFLAPTECENSMFMLPML